MSRNRDEAIKYLYHAIRVGERSERSDVEAVVDLIIQAAKEEIEKDIISYLDAHRQTDHGGR